MLNIAIISRRIRSTLTNVTHRATNSRGIHIEIEMKQLNDRKEFGKAMALFNEHKDQEIRTDRSIVQALKACTGLRDVKHGVNIHKELTNQSLNNVYIQTALIHFYSKIIHCS